MNVIKSFFLVFFATAGLCQTAEEVMDKAAQALGGERALKDIHSMVVQGRMIIPPGVTGKLSIMTKDGAKFFMVTKLSEPGMNVEMKVGCDGTDCYSSDPFMGTRLLEGQEKESALIQNDFRADLEWRKLYTKVEYKGEGQVEGKKVYKVYLETSAGMTMTNSYDAESYLALKSEGVNQSPIGTQNFVIRFYDYKDVHQGFKIPMRMTISAMNQTMEMHVDEVEVNVNIPESKFVLPAGLK